VSAEVSEDATLNDALEPSPVIGPEEAGFVKASSPVVADVGSGDDPVEDDEVQVEVRVDRGAEAVQEADGWAVGAGMSARRPDVTVGRERVRAGRVA